MAYNTDISAAFPEIWFGAMQKLRDHNVVASQIASFPSANESGGDIKYGDKFHNPYDERVILEDFTKGTDLSSQAYTVTDENFTIATRKSARVQMSKQDLKQSMYDINTSLSKRFVSSASKHIDSIVLGEYASASDNIYNDDIGGSGSTTACSLNPGNISRVFTAANKKLHQSTRGNLNGRNKFAVITPNMAENLELYIAGRETSMGDNSTVNGYLGRAYGYNVYVSNLLPWTGKWTPTDNPSNDDTISINGVTITIKTTLSGGAGEVKIGAATANTLDNLVALINDPLNRDSSSNYAAFSLSDAEKLEGCVATDGATYATFVFKGGGDVVVTSSADTWSVQQSHGLIGLTGFTMFAMQLLPTTVWKEEPYQPGGEGSFITDFFYGNKTWKEGTYDFLNLVVDSSSNN